MQAEQDLLIQLQSAQAEASSNFFVAIMLGFACVVLAVMIYKLSNYYDRVLKESARDLETLKKENKINGQTIGDLKSAYESQRDCHIKFQINQKNRLEKLNQEIHNIKYQRKKHLIDALSAERARNRELYTKLEQLQKFASLKVQKPYEDQIIEDSINDYGPGGGGFGLG